MARLTNQPGEYEDVTVRTDDFSSFAADVRRADGSIVRSSPIGIGYAVRVFWRD